MSSVLSLSHTLFMNEIEILNTYTCKHHTSFKSILALSLTCTSKVFKKA